MSKQFIQVKVYPEEQEDKFGNVMVALNMKPDEFKEKLHHHNMMLAIPLFDENYKKELIECAVNLLKLVTESARPNMHPDFEKAKRGTTEHEIHETMLCQIRNISEILQHMVNSSSWLEGIYHGFDAFEIDRRLMLYQSHIHHKEETP